MAGSILQIEPDILDRAMDFKQIPVIQKPNVSVQSRTMNQPRNLLAIGKALGCLSSADFLNFSGSPSQDALQVSCSVSFNVFSL